MEQELVQNMRLTPVCWGGTLEATLSLCDAEYPPAPRRLKGTWRSAGLSLSVFILVVQDKHKGSLCDPGRVT